ncbi:aldo/keto reductase, partial [Pseudomonas viridiflava]
YNLSHRVDEPLIAELGGQRIAYVPFFPLGGFTPLQSQTLSRVATAMGASSLCVALAWLMQRADNILLIPGTSSVAHLKENLSASNLVIPPELLAELDRIA